MKCAGNAGRSLIAMAIPCFPKVTEYCGRQKCVKIKFNYEMKEFADVHQ